MLSDFDPETDHIYSPEASDDWPTWKVCLNNAAGVGVWLAFLAVLVAIGWLIWWVL